MADIFIKDPAAVLDYQFDWKALTHAVPGAQSDWLAAAETITAHTVTVPAGIVKDSSAESGGAVTVWLSGGTAGTQYLIVCQITTSAGRKDERTMTVICENR